ncbi:hypothetical protein SKTS_34100 [Sulfurimicrobium lacus]|uniref:Ancillary SecYEG translocon subunit/Cell division coordinator CpoB TPR domain-containing protein n=1 Tax=Sulfurimicrobium lacus TaxID=2715678 RepID=A0A6F8VFS0_9PROT|nr:tetratricopeptide repeat protein [Sulfurimicrobium lacus]BCB28524.1 hypothetical protein SKTS_34100 [Sulfurimicrobium lacus]
MPTLKLDSIVLTASLLALSACAPAPLKAPLTAAPAPAAEAKKPALPNQELTSQSLYQYLVGEVALQRNQPELAADALLDLAKNSRDPRLAKRATEAAVQGRQAIQAANAAELWQSLEPDSPQATQAAAALLLNSGRLSESRPYLEKILAGEGESRANGFLHINQMLARQRDRDAVLELVRELAKPYPELAEAHFAVAQAAWNAGKHDEAFAELRRVDTLKPGWEPAALFRGLALQQTSVPDALGFYRDFLQDHPKAREVRLAYARLLVGEKQYHQARAEFQRVMDDAPNNPDIAFAIGLLAMQEGDFEAADTYLQKALGNGYKDSDVVRLYLGQVAEERKRWDEATKWYDSVEQGEYYINAQTRHASLLAKQGKLDEARQRLQQAQAQNNQQRAALIQAEAQLLREARMYQDAFDVLGKGMEKLPNNPELLYDHAMAAEKLDKLDVMEKDLRHLIQLKPDNAHAYNALGYTFAERGIRLPEARDLVEKAAALAPEDAFIMDSLGWVYFRLGQPAKALEILRHALELSRDPEIAAHLGEVLWSQGQHDEARSVWQSALKQSPENEALRNVMQKFK